jgi:hypothetical protein
MGAEDNPLIGDYFPIIEVVRVGRGKKRPASLRAESGKIVFVRLHTIPFRDENERVGGAVKIFEEVAPSFINMRGSKLAAVGGIDPMTGIVSRGMIECRLYERVQRSMPTIRLPSA